MNLKIVLALTLLILSTTNTFAAKAKPPVLPKPGLGSFTQNTKIRVTVGTSEYEWFGPATFAPYGSETRRIISGIGSFLPVSPTPTTLKLESLTVPSTVTSNSTAQGAVNLSAINTTSNPVVVALNSNNPAIAVPPTVTITPSNRSSLFSITSRAVTVSTPVVITAIYESVSKTAQITVSLSPTPDPPPTNLVNVKNYGAKGDGIADDRAAIQLAINASLPGQTIFFPTGRYKTSDSLKVKSRSNRIISGEGSANSVIVHGGVVGFQLGGGEPSTGLIVKNLGFHGLPGKYMADGNSGDSIQIHGPKGTIVEDCYFKGPGRAVHCPGQVGGVGTYGTIIRRIRVDGWGVNAIFCNGGERITDVDLIQDDPNLTGAKSSHGFYIHSGASNVTIDGMRISNARKYAGQVYGEDPNTFTDNITLRNIIIKDCANGLVVSSSQPSAARPRNLLIENITAENIYDSSGAIIVHTVDGGTIRNITVKSVSRGAGVVLGNWAPYLVNMTVKNLTVTNVNVTNAAKQAVWINGANTGTYFNVKVGPGIVGGIIKEGNLNGVTVVTSLVTNPILFPQDNPWNTPVDTLPVHANSANYLANMSPTTRLHPDFGTVWNNAPNGTSMQI